MIMVNNIGGATLSAALVADKALAPVKVAETDKSTNADMSASVAAYLSLPGFTSPLQIDTSSTTDTGDQAHALVKAVSEDESLKTALQQFDEGLKKLTARPETQIFQARFGAEAGLEDLGFRTRGQFFQTFVELLQRRFQRLIFRHSLDQGVGLVAGIGGRAGIDL